jgi:UPF0716 protein FxsA
MLFRLILVFTIVPLIELAILIYLGTIIGALYTILIVVVTGILGAVMTRYQGMVTLSKIRSNIENGIIPANELFDGALILAGGLLLLTPGIITDIIGFALLVPYTRRIVRRLSRSLVLRKIETGGIHYWKLR